MNDQRPSKTVLHVDEGKLWSFIRDVLERGRDIQMQYAGGSESYEHCSARVDAKARELSDKLVAKFRGADEPADDSEIAIQMQHKDNRIDALQEIAQKCLDRKPTSGMMRVALEEIAGYERSASEPPTDLHKAALDIYMSGPWRCDSMGADKQVLLWIALRDALGLSPGTATAAGVGASVTKGESLS